MTFDFRGTKTPRFFSLAAATISPFVVVLLVLAPSLRAQEPQTSPQTVEIRVAADSQNEGYEVFKAFDGDPRTFWHSQFSNPPFERRAIPIRCGYASGCDDEHPHRIASRKFDADRPFEIRVDLRESYRLNGFRYFPRNDGQENGIVADYELFAFESLDKLELETPEDGDAASFDADGVWRARLGEPLRSGSFASGGAAETVDFAEPISARYLVFRVKRELNDQPFAAVAELEFLSDGARFLAGKPRANLATRVERDAALKIAGELVGLSDAELEKSPYFEDLLDQFNRLVDELARPEYYAEIAGQLPNPQCGIFPEDRDPADVIVRRTRALWLHSRELDEASTDEAPADEREFFQKLAASASDVPVDNVAERFGLFLTAAFARRTLLLERAELDFERILFVKRNRSNYDHLCDQFYGRSAMPGGGLYTLSRPWGADAGAERARLAEVCVAFADGSDFATLWSRLYRPEAADLLADSKVVGDSRLAGKRLENGAFISPELSFDGEKIAFAWCECTGSAEHVETLDLSRGHTQEGRCYHVFTCNADGSDLRQITDGTWNDFDPCFLPNGRLAFISERRGGYLRCGRDCPNYTLFDMDPDGGRIRALSLHETNEWAPSVSNNGLILWTRWDYIDRFGCIAHGPWTTTPDGRNPRAVCGNYAPRHLRPDSHLDIRAIPNSSKLVATAGPHHGQSFGSIVTVDPNAPDDPLSPIARITPDVGFPESQDGAEVWGTPWPLAEDLFLAVADYSILERRGYHAGNYGIYLIDALGNRELIYRDPEIGASTPIPFVARETPPVVPGVLDESEIVGAPYVTPPPFDGERPQAVVTIQNVYAADRPVSPGTKIAAIRVVQVFCMSVPSGYPPYEIGVREATATDSVKLTRRVWGVAPVEEDGSACFYVPADCELYFQTLDENGVALQSMRSGVALRPNENLSCVGCHEPREMASAQINVAPNGNQTPLATRREPSVLQPEGPGTQPVNFPELIQPIIDEKCAGCHAEPESVAKGAPDLSRKPTRGFYASYWNLVAGGHVPSDFGDPLRTPTENFGARKSTLYPLLADHYGVELTDAERRRFALWMDTTANFYGVYEKEGCEKQFRGERAVPTLE